MIPVSPPPNAQAGAESGDNIETTEDADSENASHNDLMKAAERIKFQITLEEPEDEEDTVKDVDDD